MTAATTRAHRRRAALLLVPLALGVAGCAAHVARPEERVAFLERSYASVSSDRGQLFEVDPAVHLLLWNGLDDDALWDQGGFATSMSASFLGAFRLTRESSAPVRTPTYEPRAKLQLFRAVTLRPRQRGDESPAHHLLAALDLVVGHRSNGQQGCALADHTRVGSGDFDCTPDTSPASDLLNVQSGSFTTNYLASGASVLWVVPGASGAPTAAVMAATSGLEWNVPCGFGACMPREMRDRHGAAVARFSAEAELPSLWHLSWGMPVVGAQSELGLRATLTGSVHLGAQGRSPFGDASAEIALMSRPPHGLGLGLFVRRHQGRDPLNIRFEERLDAWLLGIVIDPGRTSAGARAR